MATQVQTGLGMGFQRGQQHVVQVCAGQRRVRRAVACLGLFSQRQHAQQARVDTAAHLQLGRKRRHCAQSRFQTQVVQHAGGVGAQLNPSPDGRERAHLLKNLDPVTRAGAGQRRRQPGDSRADHGDAAYRCGHAHSKRQMEWGLKPRSAALPLRARAERALLRLRISSVSLRTLPPRPIPSMRTLRP